MDVWTDIYVRKSSIKDFNVEIFMYFDVSKLSIACGIILVKIQCFVQILLR